MKTHSLEYLHTKIEKHIRLVQSYTEITYLGFLIRACRLKPYDYVFGDRNPATKLHRYWFDEYGNSLNITRHKKIKITYGDLHIDRNKIVSTDLYYGLSIDRVAKMSQLAYLCAGKDEDLYQECYLISFLGIDNYLRTYLYWYGEWQQVSALILGEKHLKWLCNHTDIKYFQRWNNLKNLPLPCLGGEAYLSFMPASEDFLTIISKQYERLLPIFQENT